MIAIPVELERHINYIAQVEQTTPQSWLTAKLAEVIEDYEDATIADNAKANLLKGKDHLIELDEFLARVNVEN